MLNDLEKFERILSSLSRIMGLNFEIQDGAGGVLPVTPPHVEGPRTQDIDSLSTEVMRTAAFQHSDSEDPCPAFGVPIRRGDEVVGSLVAYGANSCGGPNAGTRPFERASYGQDMRTFLEEMAKLIEENGSAQQEIDDITEELIRNFEDLHLYARISTQIKTLKFSDSMMKTLMGEIMGSMGASLTFAELHGREKENVRITESDATNRIADRDTLIVGLLDAIPEDAPSLEDNYFIVNNSEEWEDFRKLYPDPYRFLAVRVLHGSTNYGWLGLVSFNMGEIFRQTELRLLTSMAEQVAAVIANTDLYRDLERFVVNMVRSLVYAIEAKDVYTRGHSERVSNYCEKIATRLRLDQHAEEVLQWASILHDIGKIGIAEHILNKAEKLTDEEFREIQEHPTKGFNILKPIEQLAESLPAILHHHERYDGRGYPDGLKGESIPLPARIIAVADTFDAITSTRAYRAAKSAGEALKIIEEVSGSQLDPHLVALMVEIVTKEMSLDGRDMQLASSF